MIWQQTKKWGKWLLPLGLAIALTACGSGNDGASKKSGGTDPSALTLASSALADGQTYENSDFGVTLKYPKDWTIQENVMGVLAAFMSPLADKQDTFAENVTFVAQSLGGEKVSLKDLGKASAAQLKKVITDFKLESNEGAKAGQYDALKLVYTGKQGAVDLKWAQYTVIEKGNMYILTFTAPTDQFDAVNSTAENIVNSIQIK